MWSRYQIVFIKELKPSKLHRLPENVRLVGISLQRRRTPSVHVNNDLNSRIQGNLPEIFDHPLRKPVDNQHFGRQSPLADNLGQVLYSKIDVFCRKMPDALTG